MPDPGQLTAARPWATGSAESPPDIHSHRGPFCQLRRILQILLTFFSLEVVQDAVDCSHGLVHQSVQLWGARVGDLVLVEQKEVVFGVPPLQEARASSAGASLMAGRVPGGSRSEAGLPVGCV